MANTTSLVGCLLCTSNGTRPSTARLTRTPPFHPTSRRRPRVCCCCCCCCAYVVSSALLVALVHYSSGLVETIETRTSFGVNFWLKISNKAITLSFVHTIIHALNDKFIQLTSSIFRSCDTMLEKDRHWPRCNPSYFDGVHRKIRFKRKITRCAITPTRSSCTIYSILYTLQTIVARNN